MLKFFFNNEWQTLSPPHTHANTTHTREKVVGSDLWGSDSLLFVCDSDSDFHSVRPVTIEHSFRSDFFPNSCLYT